MTQLFQVLGTPEASRSRNLGEDLARFPYVIGELFGGSLRIPSFTSGMRQNRKDSHRRAELCKFQERFGTLTFFDPACGCGNFLIIAYRELRALEIEVLAELRRYTGQDQMELDATELSAVNVDQFYGIEFDEFPARIAETALWMMDHIKNNRLSLEFGQSYVRIPLQRSPHILHADALETDWSLHVPSSSCSYVLGNPPFVGAKFQSETQRSQVRRIAALGRSGGTLDYVAAWFIKAAHYIQNTSAKIGFVATNSLTQGEQVAQLWPLLFNRFGLEIEFAHRTFAWGPDARGKAHVHVVILGLCLRAHASKVRRLFIYDDINGEPHESAVASITPYLIDGTNLHDPHVVVSEVSSPMNGLPRLIIGSKPIDGGHYIFDRSEADAFLAEEPDAAPFMHPYVGSREFLNGEERFILALDGVSPATLKALPLVRQRIAAVRTSREASGSTPTREMAKTPTRFHVTVIPTTPFLVIPEVSSERREYIPIAWLGPPVIPSNKVRVLLHASLWHFGLLTSAMHMAWMRQTSGRLKSDYQYGIGMTYNTFPLPHSNAAQQSAIDAHAQAVLDVRSAHVGSTLADLYDPDSMPSDLRKAHATLDRAVDRLYRASGFTSDRERVEFLFGLYEAAMLPLNLGTSSVSPKRVSKAKK